VTIGVLLVFVAVVTVAVMTVLWRIGHPVESDEPDDPDEAVVVSSGLTEAQAEILRSKLEAMGIRAFVKGGSPIPQYGSLWNNAAVLVRRGDLAGAAEILGDDARQV
jgi:hypothetical protein